MKKTTTPAKNSITIPTDDEEENILKDISESIVGRQSKQSVKRRRTADLSLNQTIAFFLLVHSGVYAYPAWLYSEDEDIGLTMP